MKKSTRILLVVLILVAIGVWIVAAKVLTTKQEYVPPKVESNENLSTKEEFNNGQTFEDGKIGPIDTNTLGDKINNFLGKDDKEGN